MPTATAKEKEPETKAKEEKPPSDSERIDRLEEAVSRALGVRLAEFDSDEVKRARELAAKEAEEKARALIEESITKAVKPLTPDERVARLEQIVATTLGVDVTAAATIEGKEEEPEAEAAEK